MTSRVPVAASLAALLSIAQPAHAGGYVVPVTEIIPPVDMPAAPSAPNGGWWVIGGVAALGVLCLIFCGDDDERSGPVDDDDDVPGVPPGVTPVPPEVTPVPVPAAFVGAATGLAALAGMAIRRRRKFRG